MSQTGGGQSTRCFRPQRARRMLSSASMDADVVSRGWWAGRWSRITSATATAIRYRYKRPAFNLLCWQPAECHHRHYTFGTTHLNAPCSRCSVPTGVPRMFIPLPQEPRNLQSRSRLYHRIFLNFDPNPAGNPAESCRTFPLPLSCKTLVC